VSLAGSPVQARTLSFTLRQPAVPPLPVANADGKCAVSIHRQN
jgi:hypothetical protein